MSWDSPENRIKEEDLEKLEPERYSEIIKWVVKHNHTTGKNVYVNPATIAQLRSELKKIVDTYQPPTFEEMLMKKLNAAN